MDEFIKKDDLQNTYAYQSYNLCHHIGKKQDVKLQYFQKASKQRDIQWREM